MLSFGRHYYIVYLGPWYSDYQKADHFWRRDNIQLLEIKQEIHFYKYHEVCSYKVKQVKLP